MMFVKICGIQHATHAQYAAKANANFIGLIFHARSKRHVTLPQAQAIIRSVAGENLIPVGVFVQQTAKEIIQICQQTGITHVQLHGIPAKQAHLDLPQSLHRFYVVSFNDHNELMVSNPIPSLDPTRDFILFDREKICNSITQPIDQIPNIATKISLCLDRFQAVAHAPQPLRWFVAGGLRAHHVAKVIRTLNPDGVDVSSGVENRQGQKDTQLIREFIDQARGVRQ